MPGVSMGIRTYGVYLGQRPAEATGGRGRRPGAMSSAPGVGLAGLYAASNLALTAANQLAVRA